MAGRPRRGVALADNARPGRIGPHPKFTEPGVRQLISSLRRFIASESTGGVVLALAAAAALIVSNSGLAPLYRQFVELHGEVRVGGDWLVLSKPLLVWVNDLWMAVFFFLVNGHHALLRGIAYSVERIPVGQGASLAGAAEPIAREAAALFTLGFALAAPIVLGLLLVDFALGVISRNLPQVNMLVLGVPVKLVAGLLALWAWAGTFGAPAGRLYAGIYRTWAAWLATGAR